MIIVSVHSGAYDCQNVGHDRVGHDRAEFDQDIVAVGRASDNDLVLNLPHISEHHLRIIRGPASTFVEAATASGVVILSPDRRIRIGEAFARSVEITDGCSIELGAGPDCVLLQVQLVECDKSQVVSVRRIDDIGPVGTGIERDPDTLQKLYVALRRLDAATDLDEVVRGICDGVLFLLCGATHVTVALRDGDEDSSSSAYVPVMTRVRGANGLGTTPSGSVPVARSVFRKVISERAAVLAADASEDVAHAESILGASIRSTLAVPLWRGDAILGVIQADNRNAPAMLTPNDLEVMVLYASNASLVASNMRLIARLQTAQDRLRKENDYLRTREQRRTHVQTIIGESAAMRAVLAQLDRVVDTRVTVLVEGETGSGKELLASAVHYRSKRSDKLFVAQNCAAIPENLLESELFGHKRGSFTGATEDKKGLFDMAHGGTLFLDEVAEIPMTLQSKLLRALQEGEIRPVGASRSHLVDVRIVAATNKSLEAEVKAGRFREDLFYRLKVFPLRSPSLRERRDDIPLLAAAFLKRYASELGKRVGGFGQQSMELLCSYDWPGNVRELQNEVQRLVIQLDEGGFVVPELLSERIRCVEGVVEKAGVKRGTLKEMVDQVEKYLLIESLREHSNNKTNTAKTLGITREGLHKKLRSYGL